MDPVSSMMVALATLPPTGPDMSRPIDTALQGDNAAFLEHMAGRFLTDPGSVDAPWRVFFEGEGQGLLDGASPEPGPSFQARSIFGATRANGQATPGEDLALARSRGRIFQLINAFRVRGHLHARLDPLGRSTVDRHPELDPAHWGFGVPDLDQTFSTAFLKGPQSMTLRALIAYLEETYCRTIGVEFMHIHDVDVKSWLQERFERTRNRCELDPATMIFILERLCAAESFEDFLNVKYRGAKRFSLEGIETVIPLLAFLVERAASHGVREIVLGMAHRGRLNVLVQILGKASKEIFAEYDDTTPEEMLGRGDVKYHLGFSRDQITRLGDEIHLSLAFNPSHLEAVNPVVEGRVRAKQDRAGDAQRQRTMAVLIHGDAAFAGQGIVPETLNMAGLDGYTTGGTIHVILNNQIGFTTLPPESRSGPYCTDVAKMAQIPILHVNGEDPEAVVHVVQVATEFRQTFGRDVIIDMYGYRRYGHNESDEPRFTQPQMYQVIDAHPEVHEVYGRQLAARGIVTQEEVKAISDRQREKLAEALAEARTAHHESDLSDALKGIWKGYRGGPDAATKDVPTGIDPSRFDEIVRGLVRLPDDMEAHPKLKRVLSRRAACLEQEDAPLDWAMGELLAYGSLVLEGHPVRISGQDSERGTFSHRHAVLTDPRDGRRYSSLANLTPDQAHFEVVNSPLSEVGVLGFEYGYALDCPEGLVIWEAQFGDFTNGAQVIIDQFICASEDKWNRLSAVTMLLPHGYEGMGPEHSSARPERFLHLCAEDNMQVANVTTPAQIFHILRRQVLRPWRKPLIIMAPKSLLRHKGAVSVRADFQEGRFERVIPERLLGDPKGATRAVLCSGKVYYDLLDRRRETEDDHVALIRVEQLYPFPEAEILAALERHGPLDEVVWCQEEPENMGACPFLHPRLTRLLQGGPPLRWVCRAESASPATGSSRAHRMEQAEIVDRVFETGGL